MDKLESVQQFYDYIKSLKGTTFQEHLLAQAWFLMENDNHEFKDELIKILDKYNKKRSESKK